MALAGVTSFAGRVESPASITQDRDPVGDLEHLFHAMRDEQDGDTLTSQRRDDPEQLVDLMGRQRGGRLVHDQDPDVERDGLGDLHRLLLGEREAARRIRHVQADVQARHHLLGLAPHPWPVDDPAAIPMADEDVLGDRQVGEDHGLLVDRRDTQPLGILGRRHPDRLAVDEDLTRIELLDPGHRS